MDVKGIYLRFKRIGYLYRHYADFGIKMKKIAKIFGHVKKKL